MTRFRLGACGRITQFGRLALAAHGRQVSGRFIRVLVVVVALNRRATWVTRLSSLYCSCLSMLTLDRGNDEISLRCVRKNYPIWEIGVGRARQASFRALHSRFGGRGGFESSRDLGYSP